MMGNALRPTIAVFYEKGKFLQDGRFDPETVSKQCGAALTLKAAGLGVEPSAIGQPSSSRR
jgi:hypothetical protein